MTRNRDSFIQAAFLLVLGILLSACASSTDASGAGPNGCHSREGMPQCTPLASRSPATLKQGTVTAVVDARCEWNGTSVLLEPNARYRITVSRVIEKWSDSWMPESDLKDGWPGIFKLEGALVQWHARSPKHPMYSLVGAQGRDTSTLFLQGWEHTLVASREAELMFFANDWPTHYANNHGCVELRIKRLTDTQTREAQASPKH